MGTQHVEYHHEKTAQHNLLVAVFHDINVKMHIRYENTKYDAPPPDPLEFPLRPQWACVGDIIM